MKYFIGTLLFDRVEKCYCVVMGFQKYSDKELVLIYHLGLEFPINCWNVRTLDTQFDVLFKP